MKKGSREGPRGTPKVETIDIHEVFSSIADEVVARLETPLQRTEETGHIMPMDYTEIKRMINAEPDVMDESQGIPDNFHSVTLNMLSNKASELSDLATDAPGPFRHALYKELWEWMKTDEEKMISIPIADPEYQKRFREAWTTLMIAHKVRMEYTLDSKIAKLKSLGKYVDKERMEWIDDFAKNYVENGGENMSDDDEDDDGTGPDVSVHFPDATPEGPKKSDRIPSIYG
ncbi:MAG: hypothetical protein M1504_04060 [Candidatus Marsarchaeota archaeon]|nr:hypothetical protein [Candidatus Marsarchaeota archaeon]